MFDTRAMLVELTIRQWTARKHDKTISDEVDKAHSAKRGGRYNKQLIAKNALEPISKQAGRIRTFHYTRTLAWGNNGQRLLPAALFMDYRQELAALRSTFNALVTKFVEAYPQLVQDARQHLGTLFDPWDYPAVGQIERAFGVDFDIFPVPTAGDFRVDVAAEERELLRAQIEQAATERQEAAIRECYQRTRELLERVAKQCVPGTTRITDSLANSVQEYVDTIDALNVANDPALTQIGQQIRESLTVSADGLRHSEATRVAVGDKASQILESLPWN